MCCMWDVWMFITLLIRVEVTAFYKIIHFVNGSLIFKKFRLQVHFTDLWRIESLPSCVLFLLGFALCYVSNWPATAFTETYSTRMHLLFYKIVMNERCCESKQSRIIINYWLGNFNDNYYCIKNYTWQNNAPLPDPKNLCAMIIISCVT